MTASKESRIIIFDGVCNLCEYSIIFIVKRDPEGKFKFVAAQSEVGRELQLFYGVDTLKEGTVILIKNQEVYTKSNAAIEIAKDLAGPCKFISVFGYLPVIIRDYLYSVISKYRYTLFGKKRECVLPNNNLKDRFL